MIAIKNRSIFCTLLLAGMLSISASAQAQAPGTGVSHVQWSGAPVACLPDRAQRWDDNNPQQPCHCPPASYCPEIPEIKPENIDFYITILHLNRTQTSGVIHGTEVPKLMDGTVKPADVLQYTGYQMRSILYRPILNIFHVETTHGNAWRVTIDVHLVGLDGIADWLNDGLKLPVLLASRCCDSVCPAGMTPTNINKEITKPRDNGEGLLMSMEDIEQVKTDLGSVESDLRANGKLATQLSATTKLIATLQDYVDAAEPSKLADLKADLDAFNQAINDATVPASIQNDNADTIGKTDALATQVASEIHYLDNPEYMTVQVISCEKVVSYPREGCLITGTQITMADGSKKAIEDLTLDDVVKGNEGPAKIIAMSKFTQREEFMYSINGGKAFFTVEHPVLTPKGWKSVDATITSIKSGIQIIGSLKVGDTILLEGGKQLKVSSIDKVTVPGGVSAYNLSVERDGSFIANGFIMKGFKKMQMHY